MQKIERIEADIKYYISKIISEELKSSNITGMITVTSVKVTKDLGFAEVYVSIFGSKSETKCLEQLKNCKGFVRKSLASKLKVRNIPEILFKIDNSAEYGSHMNKVIKDLNISKETIE